MRPYPCGHGLFLVFYTITNIYSFYYYNYCITIIIAMPYSLCTLCPASHLPAHQVDRVRGAVRGEQGVQPPKLSAAAVKAMQENDHRGIWAVALHLIRRGAHKGGFDDPQALQADGAALHGR